MDLLFKAWADMVRSWQPLAPAQLGTSGGDPHFYPPAPDRVTEQKHGIAPTAAHVTVEPWWFWF
jgi:hypothetical protein